jgi:hypothetical protein
MISEVSECHCAHQVSNPLAMTQFRTPVFRSAKRNEKFSLVECFTYYSICYHLIDLHSGANDELPADGHSDLPHPNSRKLDISP